MPGYWLADVLLPGSWGAWRYRIGFAVATAAYLAFALRGYRRGFQEEVRRDLNECGVPVCPGCGYCVRGIADVTRCPECGADVPEKLRALVNSLPTDPGPSAVERRPESESD